MCWMEQKQKTSHELHNADDFHVFFKRDAWRAHVFVEGNNLQKYIAK